MRFFKFQPINKYSLHGLADQSFYYANPSDYNDPFEFKLHDDVCSEEYLQSICQEDGVGPKTSRSELRAKLKSAVELMVERIGVVSFSELDESPLMWGHYANNHQGMCLEFEVTDHVSSVFPIRYSDELAILKDSGNSFWHQNLAQQVMTTKHSDWSYEKEYRILNANGGRCHPYPDEFELVSVAFGIRTPNDDIKLVRHVLARSDVVFRRAIPDGKTARISFTSC